MTDANSSLLTCKPFTDHRAYTLWRLEAPDKPRADGKLLKVPVHYDGRTRHSLGNEAKGIPPNPAPPLDAQQAAGWLAHNRATGVGHDRLGEAGYLGVGFRPEGTGLVCIDLDNCITPDGQWTPGALVVMSRLPGALIEQSHSGFGVHLWVTVQGEGPGRRGQKTTPHGALEVYGEGQFIALGRAVLGGDASVDRTAEVAALVAEYWPMREDRADPGEVDWSGKSAIEQVGVLADLASALTALDPDNRDEWVSVGQALSGLGEAGYALWAEWSARSTRFPGGDGLDKWDSFTGERTDHRAVFAKAQARGWVNPAGRPALPDDAGQVFGSHLTANTTSASVPADMLLEPPAGRVVAAGADLSFMAAAQGLIAASVASVETALTSAEAGVHIAHDTFLDRLCIKIGDEPVRAFRDTDYGRLRAAFERRGFKPVPAETMATVVSMVAEKNAYDSAIAYCEGLVWDGVERIETMLPTYYGTADTPYTRAVGMYLMTGLAGRALVPGIKADMALIMVGAQGAQKTSSVAVLCPTPEAFGEVDLGKTDEEIARKLRGKMLVELAEMRGFSGRDADANKAWVSRQWEEWTPKYKEFTTRYGRRCLIWGTANGDELLDDPTGARRFLPFKVGQVNAAGIEAVRDQLWAEGVAKFKQSGIAWQQAEELAKAEHVFFEVVDELQPVVAKFMDGSPTPKLGGEILTGKRSDHPIHGHEILTTGLGMSLGQIKKTDEMRLAKIMKRLNYVRTTKWINGAAAKLWVKGW